MTMKKKRGRGGCPKSSVYPSSSAAWSRVIAYHGQPFARAQRRVSTCRSTGPTGILRPAATAPASGCPWQPFPSPSPFIAKPRSPHSHRTSLRCPYHSHSPWGTSPPAPPAPAQSRMKSPGCSASPPNWARFFHPWHRVRGCGPHRPKRPMRGDLSGPAEGLRRMWRNIRVEGSERLWVQGCPLASVPIPVHLHHHTHPESGEGDPLWGAGRGPRKGPDPAHRGRAEARTEPRRGTPW